MPYATEQDLEDVLRFFKIDVRVVGEEYREKSLRVEVFVKKKYGILS